MTEPNMESKTCTKCGETKPVTSFHSILKKSGIRVYKTRCKTCINTMSNAKYHANRQEYLARCKEYQQTPNGQQVSKRSRLKFNYGLSLEAYTEMAVRQENRCAICRTDQPGGRWNRDLFVDHNHKTGEVRGLLCHNCNAGIGHFFEDQSVLRRAIEYLNNHERS